MFSQSVPVPLTYLFICCPLSRKLKPTKERAQDIRIQTIGDISGCSMFEELRKKLIKMA
jgi:hypothetical protein